MEDFTHDFTYFLKENIGYMSESSIGNILIAYITLHQFSDFIYNISESELPFIFNDFLENNEDVYVNTYTHKLFFKIKNPKDKQLQDKIKSILKIFGIKVLLLNDNNFLEITYGFYDNTYHGDNSERIYR